MHLVQLQLELSACPPGLRVALGTQLTVVDCGLPLQSSSLTRKRSGRTKSSTGDCMAVGVALCTPPFLELLHPPIPSFLEWRKWTEWETGNGNCIVVGLLKGGYIVQMFEVTHIKMSYHSVLIEARQTRFIVFASALTSSETCHLNCHYRLSSIDTPTLNGCSTVDLPIIYMYTTC